MNPIARIKAWLERRDRRRRQLQMLEMTIREDWRWLSPDPIARELTSRYMLILDHHWHLRQHETAAAFRERVLPAFMRAWTPEPNDDEDACIDNSLRRAISVLAFSGKEGDKLDSTRLHYLRLKLVDQAAKSEEEGIERAFDVGFEWSRMLQGHVYDGRDVARTLTAGMLDGLPLSLNAVDCAASLGTATVQAKREIKRAMVQLYAARLAPAVPKGFG